MTCLGLVAPSETPPKAHARRVSPGVPLGGARVQRNGKPQPESGGDGGWGFHLRDGGRQRSAARHSVRLGQGLSRNREADVW
jgi:hypothetical protein